MEQAAGQVLFQYGAIGVMLCYMLWKDYKKDDKTNAILSEIKDVFKESVAHERGVSKDCYDRVVSKLDGIDDGVCDISGKLDEYVKCINAKCDKCRV